MRLQAPHCPSCGAPLVVPEGASRVTCTFCAATLVVEEAAHRVRGKSRPAHAEEGDAEHPAYDEPEAVLYDKPFPRFELSAIEQKVPSAVPDVFMALELDDQRFAVVQLRCVDAEGRPQAHDLSAAAAALTDSLAQDFDPGLAANLALEALCKKPFEARLEVSVVLFSPQRMRVDAYGAGWREGMLWSSGEEGRCIILDAFHPPLERKLLREDGDHFQNCRPVHLAANDLVVLPSPGFLGRGARGYPPGVRVLTETLNAHLGEEPLRVVTLAKNAFWPAFQKDLRHTPQPVGDVRVVAVRALLPPLLEALPATAALESHRSRHYAVALFKGPADATRLLPLHGDRAALVWLSPTTQALPEGAMDKACAAVHGVLDKKDHGDNDNPRAAGRAAYEAAGLSPEQARLAVVQLFDAYHRVKYFRAGWKQPVALSDRGRDESSMQQFDEGGEATVNPGHRLFFPGAASYEGHHATPGRLAEAWPGGKASRLYEALREHWKVKKGEVALGKLARALLSDQPQTPLGGLLLVTALPVDAG
jgi:LSD1 subclass zinc finger protein